MNSRLMKYIASTSPTVKKKYVTGLVLDLGLTGDRRDGLATGQAVTDRRTDGAAAEGESAADQCTGDADRFFKCLCSHYLSFLLVGLVGNRDRGGALRLFFFVARGHAEVEIVSSMKMYAWMVPMPRSKGFQMISPKGTT
jgi:hypothetical protein